MRLVLQSTLLAALVVAPPAAAHQCDLLGKSPDVELAIIREHPDVRLFCQRCGDTSPVAFRVAKATAVAGPSFPALVDLTDPSGRSRRVDVASVFVRLDPKARELTNVANRAACDRRFSPHTISDAARR